MDFLHFLKCFGGFEREGIRSRLLARFCEGFFTFGGVFGLRRCFFSYFFLFKRNFNVHLIIKLKNIFFLIFLLFLNKLKKDKKKRKYFIKKI